MDLATPAAPATESLVEGISRPRWSVWKASGVAFTASAATLVLELVAGSLMAPWLGVNLYSGRALSVWFSPGSRSETTSEVDLPIGERRTPFSA